MQRPSAAALDAAAPKAIDEGALRALMLRALPARTRALIEATKLEGVGVAEAAERAGMSEAAAKVAVHRGLKRLAELFGRPRSP